MGSKPVGYVQLWGCLGRLSLIGAPGEGHTCFLWRTDQRLLDRQRSGGRRLFGGASLLHNLACEVAELYHRGLSIQLQSAPALPSARLRVMWLELAADGALLVFLKPIEDAEDETRGTRGCLTA